MSWPRCWSLDPVSRAVRVGSQAAVNSRWARSSCGPGSGRLLVVALVGDPDQPGGGHQPGDPLATAADPEPESESGVDPRGAVGAARCGVGLGDSDGQGRVDPGPSRQRPGQAVVVTRARQVEHPGRSP